MMTEQNITEQNRKRVKAILNSLKSLRYSKVRPAGEVCTAAGSYELKTRFDKSEFEWRPFAPGDTWGGRDSHTWFAVTAKMPPEYENQTVVLSLNTGAADIWNTDNPQVLVYAGGELTAAMDMNHTRMTLTEAGKAGDSFELGFYAYSNSEGKTNFFDITLGILHRDVEALYYDMKVMWEAAELLKEDDLERIHLLRILNDCASRLDLRCTDSAEFFQSVETAREYLRDHYYQAEHNISPVTVSAVGHTHIDVAWKWPLRQTKQKAVRSFLTVLNLMEEYPEYRFMSSQPQLYEFVKKEAPEVYARIKERVKEGRWETEGAMWLEADCNLISGESMIRQILYGKEFFRREFGTGDDEVMWLPDVFGYSVAMPQILRQSGIKYFMTTKIGWNEYNRIPNDTMMWRGLDGSEVLAYFITTSDYCRDPELNPKRSFGTTYNGLLNAGQVMGTWQRYQNKEINEDVLTCYGYGDGGGGTTPQMLEEGRRLAGGVGRCPVVRQSGVREFFRRLEANLEGKKIPKWCGELYLEFHRGTYTSMARNKKQNRKCEFLLGDAEFWQVFAMAMKPENRYPKEELDRAWKLVLLNQFHDILPGSSCKDVYEDSDTQYEEVRRIGEGLVDAARSDILESAVPMEAECHQTQSQLAVFNQLSFARTGIVEVYDDIEICDTMETDRGAAISGSGGSCWNAGSGTTGGDGTFQRGWDGAQLYLIQNAPSKGVEILNANQLESAVPAGPVIMQSDETDGRLSRIQTRYYDIQFNSSGEIISLYDIEETRQIIRNGEAGNRLLAFEDRPEEYDAWNIDAYYEEKQWTVDNLLEFKILENGPLRACIRIHRRFQNSEIEQDLCLYHHTRRIDFKTRVDWKEHQILLKTSFPVDVLADKATYEVQFGNVERPTHRNTSWDQARFEVCMHKWADISEYGYGVAILNDCKYGMDIRESVMRLTLLKSGIFPNPDADNEIHEFTYSLYPHKGGFREGRVIQEAYDLNCPLQAVKTAGKRAMACSYIRIEAENIFADTVKQAEDGNGVIVRLYEAYGQRTRTRISLAFADGKQVEECDCLERKTKELTDDILNFRPYEIKTLRIYKGGTK